MLVAQITDTHVSTPGSSIDEHYCTAAYLERAVAHLNALDPRPDLVVVTGDLVERGETAEYERLRQLLAPLAMPVHLLPGNHDNRASIRRVFGDHAYVPAQGNFLQYVIETGPVRLLALDTLVPGESGGQLCDERLAWLDARLAEAPTRPTVVFMHHPPFATGMRKMDQMGLADSAGLAAVIRRHPQVERIACGHLHRFIIRRFAGTVACTAPATAHQLALCLGSEPTLATVMEPPACLLHLWLGERDGLVTHVSVIGDQSPEFTVFDGRQWMRDAVPPPDFHPSLTSSRKP